MSRKLKSGKRESSRSSRVIGKMILMESDITRKHNGIRFRIVGFIGFLTK